ncbi:MAG: SsrA-binding protein SmpB [Candidatus Eisenbacteria bacterium]|nr:SsrA-binding protein SmpB [Candidatus Eisenbacteria bacterium]
MAESEVKIISSNRRARKDFLVIDTFEAGIVLSGTEVKSIRQGRVNLKQSYATIRDGEVFLYNLHINPYEFGNRFNLDPTRRRKLLLHKSQIRRLIGKVSEKGLTLIPMSLYFKKGYAKIGLALARGKKLYDRREEIKKKDMEREMRRTYRGKR